MTKSQKAGLSSLPGWDISGGRVSCSRGGGSRLEQMSGPFTTLGLSWRSPIKYPWDC